MPTTSNYIWDDDNLLAEADGTNTINTVYTNEPEKYGNLVSSRIANTTSYHHFDALGSTRQLTNAVGHVTDTAIYGAWGNIANRTGTTPAFQLWVGQSGYYCDPETRLVYVRARVVDPAIGRWTSVDPIGFVEGADLYIYVANCPVLQYDGSGLFGKTSSVVLTMEVVEKAMVLSNCGGAESSIKWGIATKNRAYAKGWILQHVSRKIDVFDCLGNPIQPPPHLDFTEAWYVTFGVISFEDGDSSGASTDTFRTEDYGKGTKGTVTIIGKARFIDNYELTQPPWGQTNPVAGDLPSIDGTIEGWDDTGGLERTMLVKWTCCCSPDAKTQASSTP